MALENNLETARDAFPSHMSRLAKDRWGFKRGFYQAMNEPENLMEIEELLEGRDGVPLDLAGRRGLEQEFMAEYAMKKRLAGETVPMPLYPPGDEEFLNAPGSAINEDRRRYLVDQQKESHDYQNYRLPDDFDTRHMPEEMDSSTEHDYILDGRLAQNRGPQSIWKRLKTGKNGP